MKRLQQLGGTELLIVVALASPAILNAAELPIVTQCRELAGFHEKGFLMGEPEEGAIETCEQAVKAEPDNSSLYAYLARAYWKKPGMEAKALEPAKHAAMLGNPLGMAALGVVYEEGYGLEKDNSLAMDWYKRSAEAGNALGQNNYAAMLEDEVKLGARSEKPSAGQLAKIESLYKSAADQGLTVSKENLANFYFNQARYAEAWKNYSTQAYAHTDPSDSKSILDKKYNLNRKLEKYGENNLKVVEALVDLGKAYFYALYDVGGISPERVEQPAFVAEGTYLRAIEILTRINMGGGLEEAEINKYLGRLYSKLGRIKEAGERYNHRLEIQEKFLGPSHLELAETLRLLIDLKSADQLTGFTNLELEPLLRRRVIIFEHALGNLQFKDNSSLPDKLEQYNSDIDTEQDRKIQIKRDLLTSLLDLEYLLVKAQRFSDAENMLNRAMLIAQNSPDERDKEDVISIIYRFVELKDAQGLNAEAENYFQRWHELTGIPYEKSSSASVDRAAKRKEAAKVLEDKRIKLDARFHISASDDPTTASAKLENAIRELHIDSEKSINEIATVYEDSGQPYKALPFRRHWAQLVEKYYGKNSSNYVYALDFLMHTYFLAGNFTDADLTKEAVFKSSALVYGESSFKTASEYFSYARRYSNIENLGNAIKFSRRGVEVLRKRYLLNGQNTDELSAIRNLSEQKQNKYYFASFLDLLSRANQPSLAKESFEVAQLAQASNVGRSIAQMAARFSTKKDDLAKVIRDKQDTLAQLEQIDDALLGVLGQSVEKRNPERESALREKKIVLEQSLVAQTQNIKKHFPEYDAMVSPAPVSVDEIQKLLSQEEAILFYLADEDKGIFAWVVRKDRVDFQKLSIDYKALQKQVSKLRTRLDPEQNPEVEEYDTKTANKLYQEVFAPFEVALNDAKHIIQVNDGALQSLPFPVLVDKPTEEGKPASWLSDRFAFTVIPSVSSLRAIRTFARAGSGKEPFQGFGNPLLDGQPGQQRRLTSRALFTRGFTTGQGSQRNGIADVEAIRKAAPLPDTETELKAFAQSLNAGQDSVKVQQLATETQVKQSNLSQYNILAFATHGVMAGELSGISEPGLILTPPKEGTALDDGYLSASEVAQLKLNADWVILSACNTAAPDGTPGAEGLTGLAKGFFYAGAKSLLVSNWYVVSDAATQLTTDMFKRYRANPKQGKAEALRQAMQALRQNPKFNHPLYWAPFSVVGEGM